MCLGVTTSCSIKVAAVINVPSLLISPLLPKCLRPFRNRNGSTGSVPAIDTGYLFSKHNIILISIRYLFKKFIILLHLDYAGFEVGIWTHDYYYRVDSQWCGLLTPAFRKKTRSENPKPCLRNTWMVHSRNVKKLKKFVRILWPSKNIWTLMQVLSSIQLLGELDEKLCLEKKWPVPLELLVNSVEKIGQQHRFGNSRKTR